MAYDVEAYLNGELHGEALDAFERELQQNPVLREELAQQRDIMNALQHIRRRERIADAADQNRREHRQRRFVLGLTLLTLFGGLVLLYFYWIRPASPALPFPPQHPPVPENQQIPPSQTPSLTPPQGSPPFIAQNQLPPGKTTEPGPLVRGGEEPDIDRNMVPLFDTVMLQSPPFVPRGGSFDAVAAQVVARAYTPALARLQKMNTRFVQNDTLQYLTALCLLLQKQPVKASAYLFPLNRPDSPFREETQWLLGLDFLLQGKRDAAIKTLQLVQKNTAHPRSEAAGRLLDKVAMLGH